MTIENPKVNPSSVALPLIGNVVWFVNLDGRLQGKDENGDLIDVSGIGYSGLMSSTQVTATGSKVFTVNKSPIQTAFTTGQRVRGSNSNGGIYFEGAITAFTSTTDFTVLIDLVSGAVSGVTSWSFLVAGNKGDTGTSYSGLTSTTSNIPAISASKTFTTNLSTSQTAFSVGQRVRAASSANPTTNFMEGVITAFSGNTLTIGTVDFVGPTPLAATDWNFSAAGNPASAVTSSVAVLFTDDSQVQYVTINDANVSANNLPSLKGVLLNTTEIDDPLNLYDVSLVSVSAGSFVVRVSLFDVDGDDTSNIKLPTINVLYSV